MNKILKIVSFFWLLLCASIAVLGVFQSQTGNSEGGIAPALLIMFLTLPASFLPQLIYAGILKFLYPLSTSMSLIGDILLYSAMIVFGYIQWFILLPKIVKRVRHNQTPKVWAIVIVCLLVIIYGLYRFYIHVFPGLP